MPKKKMNGVGFWMIVTVSLIKDTLDLLLNITIVLTIFVQFSTLFFGIIIGFYLFYVGVKPTTKKLAIWLITVIIELTPIISLLPSGTFMLFVIRKLENNEAFKKFSQQKMLLNK